MKTNVEGSIFDFLEPKLTSFTIVYGSLVTKMISIKAWKVRTISALGRYIVV